MKFVIKASAIYELVVSRNQIEKMQVPAPDGSELSLYFRSARINVCFADE